MPPYQSPPPQPPQPPPQPPPHPPPHPPPQPLLLALGGGWNVFRKSAKVVPASAVIPNRPIAMAKSASPPYRESVLSSARRCRSWLSTASPRRVRRGRRANPAKAT